MLLCCCMSCCLHHCVSSHYVLAHRHSQAMESFIRRSSFFNSFNGDNASEAFFDADEVLPAASVVPRPFSWWGYLCCSGAPTSAVPITNRPPVFVSCRPRDLPRSSFMEDIDSSSLTMSRVNRRRRVRRMTSHHVMEQRFSGYSHDHDDSSVLNSGGGDQLIWVNWLLMQLWPRLNSVIREKLETEVLPIMRESIGHRVIELKEFDLGKNTPKLGPIRTSRRDHGTHESLDVNVHIHYDCDSRVAFSIGMFSVGIEHINFTGDLCLSLEPLIDEIPLIGGVQVTLSSLPSITWAFSGLANLADMPGISSLFQTTVEKTIRETLLLPNCVYVPLQREKVHPNLELAYPKPSAVLQISVHRLRGLPRGKSSHIELSLGSKLIATPKGEFNVAGYHEWQPPFTSDFFVYTRNQPIVVRLCSLGGDHLSSATIKVRDLIDEGVGAEGCWVAIADGVEVNIHGRLRRLDHACRPLNVFRQILVTIDLYCAGSLIEAGSRVRFSLPGASPAMIISKPGMNREADVEGDLSREPRTQRIIEKLRKAHGMTAIEVATIAEVDPYVVDKVLREKPSLNVVWNQAVYTLMDISRVNFDDINLRVEVLRKSRSLLGGEILDFLGDIALREVEDCEQMSFRGTVLLHGKASDKCCDIELGVEIQGVET